MKELKDTLTEKDFVIKPIILESINKFKLSINEFLLILYFINVKNELDSKDIINKYDMNEKDVLNAFNSLLEKRLIETTIVKTKSGIEEKISLDIFYDKLLLNKKEKKEKKTDIYGKFESEFGRTLNTTEYETITAWLEKGYDEKTIIKALKESVLNGVTNLRYIDKILYEWYKKESKGSRDFKPLFDYDWLEENE